MSWMNFTLISINLILSYLVFLMINKNGRHLLLNRWFLIGFPIFPIALGIINHYSNGSVLTSFSIELPLIEAFSTVEPTDVGMTINWAYWIYAFGTFLSLFHFGWSLWNVRKPADAKLLNKLGKQYIYLVGNRQHSFSHLNKIYISEFQLDNVEYILKHELAHSRQKHSLDLIFIRIIRSFFWFHPVVYLWEMKMKENHEYLADQNCISDYSDVKPYSYALLSSHLGVSIPDLASGFNRQSLLQKRIIQLKTQNTFNMKKVILIPAALFGVVLMTSVQLESNTLMSTTQTIQSETDEKDKEPEFIGGMDAMTKYMQMTVQYPMELATKNLEAKIYVKFVVSSTGKIEKVTIARGSEHEAFNKEAIRVISNMPDWSPGLIDGKAVSVEMTIPIVFQLK